ncbi:14013_t:CDS:1 [Acaulospora colombiana]|uniref:14013_t:CDS:1 n=1 Tax=Acaulospora colombiana TaxID=27376 RepID=A0ACA9QFZ4_9GLOM|nr:14013_t:CDS:1 [Acaulospora colombiana]
MPETFKVSEGSASPLIKVPFPPTIDPPKLITSKADGTLPRSPNAFMIYRKAFVEAVRAEGYSFPMTVVSAMASRQWEQIESEEIRAYYKRLAKEACEYKKKKYPSKSTGSRRKRTGWSVMSFRENRKEKKRTRLDEKEVNSSTLTTIHSEDATQTFGDFSFPNLSSDTIASTTMEQLHVYNNLLNAYPSPEFSDTFSPDFSSTNNNSFPELSSPESNNDLYLDFSTSNVNLSPDLGGLFVSSDAQSSNIFQTEEQDYIDSQNFIDSWELQFLSDNILINNTAALAATTPGNDDELQTPSEALYTFDICEYQY